MYEQHEEKYVGRNIFGSKDKSRRLFIADHEIIRESTAYVNKFDLSNNTVTKSIPTDVLVMCNKSVVYGSFKQHLLEKTNMRNYCEAGIKAKQESFVLAFITTQDVTEESQINRVCQQIMTHILIGFDKACSSCEKNILTSFWVNVYVYLDSQDFEHALKQLPVSMLSRIFLRTIFFLDKTL